MHGLMRNKRSKHYTAQPRPLWQRALAAERLPKRLSRRPKCEGTVEDHRNIALDVRELIRKRVFEQPVGSIFRLNIALPDAAQIQRSRTGPCHRPHHRRAPGFGQLRRHGPANEAGVSTLCSARLRALPCPRQSRVWALSRPLVCGTAHQQLRQKGAGQAEGPPQAR